MRRIGNSRPQDRMFAEARIAMPSDQQRSRNQEGSQTRDIIAAPHGRDLLRAKTIRETQPSSRKMEDLLNLSVTEVAVMWILHQRTLSPMSAHSLARTIVEFYPVALNTISRAESLSDAMPADLRLIYFKGLIVAQTHPRWQMVNAIRHADRALDPAKTSNEPMGMAALQSVPEPHLADQDTLAHIADALSRSTEPSH